MVDESKYAEAFQLVDADGDGLISAVELQSMMQAMGDEVTDERAKVMVEKVDTDGDGKISLQEFASFLASGS